MPVFLPPLLVLVIPLGLWAAGFWIWMLVDCLHHQTLSGSQRCWAMFILFAHLIGAIVYSLTERSRQTTPLVPEYSTPQGSHREPMQPEEYRSYQEGYPIQPFHQDERTSPDPAPVEHRPVESQTRSEEMHVPYPGETHELAPGSPSRGASSARAREQQVTLPGGALLRMKAYLVLS